MHKGCRCMDDLEQLSVRLLSTIEEILAKYENIYLESLPKLSSQAHNIYTKIQN